MVKKIIPNAAKQSRTKAYPNFYLVKRETHLAKKLPNKFGGKDAGLYLEFY